MHAVVFAHMPGAQYTIVSMLKASGFYVCHFTSSMIPRRRHEIICNFQKSGGTLGGVAKVFVITMKTGSVGITLTAASRVYLMEPCFDPAMEVQAAGRVHRLGQSKDALIKKFAFRDSIDENICKLHAEMRKPGNKMGITNGKLPRDSVRILYHGV